MGRSFRYSLCIVLATFLLLSCTRSKLTLHLDFNASAPEIIYGVEKIKELHQSNVVNFSDSNPDLTIHARLDTVNLKNEAYRIVSQNRVVEVAGGDEVGLW